MKVTKEMLKALRPELDAAVAAIAKKYGLEMHTGNASYDPTLGTFKFQLVGKDAEGEPPELKLLKQYADMLGIDMTYLDRDYVVRGVGYRLCGLKNGRELKALATSNEDGKVYVFKAKAFWTEQRKKQEREFTMARMN